MITKEEIAELYKYFHNIVGQECYSMHQVHTQCVASSILVQAFLKQKLLEEN